MARASWSTVQPLTTIRLPSTVAESIEPTGSSSRSGWTAVRARQFQTGSDPVATGWNRTQTSCSPMGTVNVVEKPWFGPAAG